MLLPVTKTITDHSTNDSFKFCFHCDVCGKKWQSPLHYSSKKVEILDKSVLALLWQSEHDAAYERANLEAIRNFNRCPKCGSLVCNECFTLDSGSDGGDLCKVCAKYK